MCLAAAEAVAVTSCQTLAWALAITVLHRTLHLTAAGISSKRWWRSHADHQSRCFSRETLPACKTPWRNFRKSRRKIYLSRLQELSRVGFTNSVKEREVLRHLRCRLPSEDDILYNHSVPLSWNKNPFFFYTSKNWRYRI